MTLTDRIALEIAEWESLSVNHKRQMCWKKAADLDVNTRNLIIAGGYVSKYFPQLSRFQPQTSEPENDIEYAPLVSFLTLLAGDQEYIAGLTKMSHDAMGAKGGG